MPFVIPFIIIAAVWPYFMAALFEWSLDPASWGWYTRAILAIIYAGFGGVLLRLLYRLSESYFGLSNRKRNTNHPQ